jgi:hypothetical protein
MLGIAGGVTQTDAPMTSTAKSSESSASAEPTDNFDDDIPF